MRGLSISQLYLNFFAAVMLGYMTLDKGFAYVGANPLFIGEITLVLGFFVVLAGAYSVRVFRSPIAWALVFFMMWHAFRTLPFLDVHGLNTFRDAVLWAYGLFAFLIAGILLKTNKMEAVPNLYARVFPGVLAIGLVGMVITELLFESLPKWPGTDTSLIMVKASDLGVQVAGALAFLALGLQRVFPRKKRFNIPMTDMFAWMIVLVSSIVVLSRSRGGFVAIACAGILVTMFRPNNRMIRMAAPALIIGILFVALDVDIPLSGGRSISPQQIMTNLLSVVTEQDKDVLDTTETWRKRWWGKIIDDTVFGNKFWLGRGYGISHAQVDGFTDVTGNRSPHNAHINLLGRGGVPGFLVWLGLIVTIFTVLTRCYLRAQAAGRKDLAALNLWVMAYGLAYLVAASFDVYLEGPQGGIPFWCLVGFAIALSEAQRAPVGAETMSRTPWRRGVGRLARA